MIVTNPPVPLGVGGVATAQARRLIVRRAVVLRVACCSHRQLGIFPRVNRRKEDAEDTDVQYLLGLRDQLLRPARGGNAHEWHHVRLQGAALVDRSLVGHAEQEQPQPLDVERRVLHVDEYEIETGGCHRAGIVQGVVERQDAERGLVVLEQLDQLVEPGALLGQNGLGRATQHSDGYTG